MTKNQKDQPKIKIRCGNPSDFIHELEEAGLKFWVMTELDQNEFEHFDVLTALCQSGLDVLGNDADDQSDQPFADPVGGMNVFTGLTMHLSDIGGDLEPLRDIESDKFHQHINWQPSSPRREGKQAKHTRALMRGKKK